MTSWKVYILCVTILPLAENKNNQRGYKLETTTTSNQQEPDKPSWMFPGDIVEIHAPEDDILFHEEWDKSIPSNDHQQQEQSSNTGEELQEEQDNTPQRLSPNRQYIPAGAEGVESNSSSSTYEEEETVEEELAQYFNNPSYRAAPSPFGTLEEDLKDLKRDLDMWKCQKNTR